MGQFHFEHPVQMDITEQNREILLRRILSGPVSCRVFVVTAGFGLLSIIFLLKIS